jgi:hypothetical protein
VSDDNNNAIDANTIFVIRDEDGSSRGVLNVDFPDTYTGGSGSGGGTDYNDDWAILELTSAWSSPSATDMSLSQASDSVLEDLGRVRNLAYPLFTIGVGCVNQQANTLFRNIEYEPIANVMQKRLRLKIDGSPGHSGGAYYYCPDGDDDLCTSTSHGFVIGINSGYNPANKRMVGPKASYFRDAALAFMYD